MLIIYNMFINFLNMQITVYIDIYTLEISIYIELEFIVPALIILPLLIHI